MPMGGCVLHGVPGYQPHRPLRSFLKIWWWQGGRKRRETGGLHVGGVSASYITSLYFIMFVTIEHILHISDFQTQVQSLSQGGWGPGPEWESSSRFDFGPPESSRGLWGGHLPRALVILRPPLGSSAETRGKHWGNNIHWILKLDFEEDKLS